MMPVLERLMLDPQSKAAAFGQSMIVFAPAAGAIANGLLLLHTSKVQPLPARSYLCKGHW